MYEYRAHVVTVYDGDTFRADVDLGFRATLHALDFRMLGINAPELHGPTAAAGLRSRDALRGQILDRDVTIQTVHDTQEKFGRWLAIVIDPADGTSINDWMVANGYAVPYNP